MDEDSFDFFAVSNRDEVVSVFAWNGTEWEETQILVASDGAPLDFFGSALAIDGDTLVVGAPGVDGASSSTGGAAYVFRWNGASWVEEQKLLSPVAPGVWFGTAVATDGDRVVVGTLEAPGAAYAFEWNGASWSYAQTLPDPSGSSNDFAHTLAADGGVLVVGARAEDEAAYNAGAVHVYRHDGTSYAFEQTLFAPDADMSDVFGHDVAIAGDRLLASALLDDEASSNAGAGYLFEWNGSAWAFVQKLLPGPGPVIHAGPVALGSDFAVVGWWRSPNGGGPSGRAHVYRESAGVWSIDATLLPTFADDNDFGTDVAAGETLLVVGTSFGAAYAYDLGVCGNGRVGEDEACDDANGASGDGCSPTCVVEECSNGTDDDGDGLADYPADPGCRFAASLREQRSVRTASTTTRAPASTSTAAPR